MKNITATLFCAFLLLKAVYAYEIDTHADMSEYALRKSETGADPLEIRRLGLRSIAKDTPWYRRDVFQNHNRRFGTTVGILRFGAQFEDSIFDNHILRFRPMHHFFDPVHDRQLTSSLIPFDTYRNPNWALKDDPSSPIADQEYSYHDAKEFYRLALTATNMAEYRKYWGLTWQSIGQIIHLLEDTAQPGHVRNDMHLTVPFLPTVSDRFWADPSWYEEYTNHLREQGGLTTYLRQEYATVRFATPRQFWVGNLKGLSQFTNRNFVSKDTNFRPDPEDPSQPAANAEYPNPMPIGGSNAVSLADLMEEKGNRHRGEELCAALQFYLYEYPPGTVCAVDFYATNVFDAYVDPTGQHAQINERASADTIFNQYLSHWNVGPLEVPRWGDPDEEPIKILKLFTLNEFTFDNAHPHLIPKAVSYSAGLIDHFFRGSLEIQAPDELVYGIVDHALIKPHEFTKVKLKVRNSSKPIVPLNSSPIEQEIIGTGRLTAVARYKRNLCYESDLSGEINSQNVIPSGCSLDFYVLGPEEISISEPITIHDGLSRVEFKNLTFDFTDTPIPINVQDLILQVVYTEGVLGGEIESVAVGTVNLSEPTYLTFYNNTDYFELDGQFYLPSDIQDDPRTKNLDIDPEPLQDFIYGSDSGHQLTNPTTLQPKNLFRIAVLSDAHNQFPFRMPVLGIYKLNDGFVRVHSAQVQTLRTQLFREPLNLSSIDNTRGFYHWFLLWFFKSNDTAPTPADAIKSLPKLDPVPSPTPIDVLFN